MSFVEDVCRAVRTDDLVKWIDQHKQGGLSYREITEIFATYGVQPHPRTVWRWHTGRSDVTLRKTCCRGHVKNAHNWKRTRSGRWYCRPCTVERNRRNRQRRREDV